MYLNEKSWHVQQEDLYVIDEKIRKFLDIYALMKRKNPRKEIFVSEDEQLYIDSKNYPLAKWLSEADIEYRRLYLSFWSKRITYKPEDEYEVNVEDEILKGGTEAYLNDSFMVSIGLDEKWEQKDIKATLFSVYEEEQEIMPGSPDIVLTKYKIAIFCDSEFFHGKDWESLKLRLEKGKNPDYWIKKIERNRSRDFETDKKLLFLGYTVIHFWGQDIKKHTNECLQTIEEVIWDSIVSDNTIEISDE